jgi:hypothetical protein
VAVGALFGFAWHNQPARPQSVVDRDESAAIRMRQVNWGMVVVWSLVFLSLAGLLLAGGILWFKRHDGLLPISYLF